MWCVTRNQLEGVHAKSKVLNEGGEHLRLPSRYIKTLFLGTFSITGIEGAQGAHFSPLSTFDFAGR
jgi:hypothetical protein